MPELLVSFSDEQMTALLRLMEPLHPRDRGAFMREIAERFRGREAGDGELHRVAIALQRNYLGTLSRRGPGPDQLRRVARGRR